MKVSKRIKLVTELFISYLRLIFMKTRGDYSNLENATRKLRMVQKGLFSMIYLLIALYEGYASADYGWREISTFNAINQAQHGNELIYSKTKDRIVLVSRETENYILKNIIIQIFDGAKWSQPYKVSMPWRPSSDATWNRIKAVIDDDGTVTVVWSGTERSIDYKLHVHIGSVSITNGVVSPINVIQEWDPSWFFEGLPDLSLDSLGNVTLAYVGCAQRDCSTQVSTPKVLKKISQSWVPLNEPMPANYNYDFAKLVIDESNNMYLIAGTQQLGNLQISKFANGNWSTPEYIPYTNPYDNYSFHAGSNGGIFWIGDIGGGRLGSSRYNDYSWSFPEIIADSYGYGNLGYKVASQPNGTVWVFWTNVYTGHAGYNTNSSGSWGLPRETPTRIGFNTPISGVAANEFGVTIAWIKNGLFSVVYPEYEIAALIYNNNAWEVGAIVSDYSRNFDNLWISNSYSAPVGVAAATDGTFNFFWLEQANDIATNVDSFLYRMRSAVKDIGVTINANLTGKGMLWSNPSGIYCSTNYPKCSFSFIKNQSVTLKALTWGSGYKFYTWSGGCLGMEPTCTTLANAQKNVTANFIPLNHNGITIAKTGDGLIESIPQGITCGSICISSFPSDQIVTLSAKPVSGWQFSGWGGACSGTGSCVVAMNAAKSVSATFTQSAVNYTLSVSKSGNGTITSNPAGINCGGACSANYSSGTNVTLTATPLSGWQFSGWGGACSGTGSCVVAMNAAKSVSATFMQSAVNYTLSVSKSGNGTITSNPAGINCGGACSANYSSGTNVSLTATPLSGWQFSGWGGACSGTGSCVVAMNAAKSVTASFTQLPKYSLTVTKAGTGTVTSNPAGINCGSTCSFSFFKNTNVTLTPTSGNGYKFSGWSGACTGTGACVVSMTASKSVKATFTTLPKYSLRVSKTNYRYGTVKSAPTGINCGTTCSSQTGYFSGGTSVNLTPTPISGRRFSNWSGACTGSGACNIPMNSNKTVTAVFR